MVNEELHQALASEVTRAFKNTGKPKNKKQVGRDPIGGAFGGTHWRNISPDLIDGYHIELHDLSPEWYRYYLPAFLIAMLLHDERGNILDAMRYALVPPDEENIFYGTFHLEVEKLTNEQRRVIHKIFANYTLLFPNDLWPKHTKSGEEELARALEFWSPGNG